MSQLYAELSFFIMIKGDLKIIFVSVTKTGKKTTNKSELLFFQNKFTLQLIELNINKWTIKLFLISSTNPFFSSLKTRRKLYENSVFGVTLIRIFPTFSRIWTEYEHFLRSKACMHQVHYKSSYSVHGLRNVLSRPCSV